MLLNLTRVEVDLLAEALDDHIDRLFARCEQMPEGGDKARLETLASILEDISDVLHDGVEETLQ